MKLLFIIFCGFFFIHKIFAQEINVDSALHKKPGPEVVDKPEKLIPIHPEKLAWDMMLPFNYKKQEKTREMKSFEQMLLRMKSGVGELSLLMGEFELKSVERASLSGKK